MLSGHARLRMPHGPRCNSSLGQLVGTKPISAVPSDGSSGYRLERSHRHPGRSAPTTPSRWLPESSIVAPVPTQPGGLPLSLRPAMTLCSQCCRQLVAKDTVVILPHVGNQRVRLPREAEHGRAVEHHLPGRGPRPTAQRVWRSQHVKHPMVDLRLFADGNLAATLMLAFDLALFDTIAIQPLSMEQLLGYPVATAGLALVPRGLRAALRMLIVARLAQRVDPRWVDWSGVLQGLDMGAVFVTLPPPGRCHPGPRTHGCRHRSLQPGTQYRQLHRRHLVQRFRPGGLAPAWRTHQSLQPGLAAMALGQRYAPRGPDDPGGPGLRAWSRGMPLALRYSEHDIAMLTTVGTRGR